MDPEEVRERWAERSGEYSPDYYAHLGPNETSELVRERIDAIVGQNASVLELGCNVGRHLEHLRARGYDRLHGIELNAEALDVMAETYPDLAAEGTFYDDAIERVLPEFDDGQFDAIYSVQTLQHIHPDDAQVFEEVARVTGGCLVVVENEWDDDGQQPAQSDVKYIDGDFPLYYRNWNHIFTDLGLTEVDSQSIQRDTLRMFVPD